MTSLLISFQAPPYNSCKNLESAKEGKKAIKRGEQIDKTEVERFRLIG
ncbi:MAG: hypothetical protein M3247_05480 [Thermoproteota archaeon]|nr:hypothetical protein [Thermoproteota archaeon]